MVAGQPIEASAVRQGWNSASYRLLSVLCVLRTIASGASQIIATQMAPALRDSAVLFIYRVASSKSPSWVKIAAIVYTNRKCVLWVIFYWFGAFTVESWRSVAGLLDKALIDGPFDAAVSFNNNTVSRGFAFVPSLFTVSGVRNDEDKNYTNKGILESGHMNLLGLQCLRHRPAMVIPSTAIVGESIP